MHLALVRLRISAADETDEADEADETREMDETDETDEVESTKSGRRANGQLERVPGWPAQDGRRVRRRPWQRSIRSAAPSSRSRRPPSGALSSSLFRFSQFFKKKIKKFPPF